LRWGVSAFLEDEGRRPGALARFVQNHRTHQQALARFAQNKRTHRFALARFAWHQRARRLAIAAFFPDDGRPTGTFAAFRVSGAERPGALAGFTRDPLGLHECKRRVVPLELVAGLIEGATAAPGYDARWATARAPTERAGSFTNTNNAPSYTRWTLVCGDNRFEERKVSS